MKVAVLTCTRDRLDYTQHCYGTFKANAGCPYDLYVVDQDSQDGTAEWLADHTTAVVITLGKNIGICPALNLLLDDVLDPYDYDVVVRWDNDCEVLQPGTLERVAGLACAYDMILAPRVLGLRNPPAVLGELDVGGEPVDEVGVLGGVYMAIPAELFSLDGYRYDEAQPPWSGDELIVPWFLGRGGHAGYLRNWQVNHYKTTEGQAADKPEYFARRVAEGGPAL
jgi:glycosyltransferase involved in cell wall biosynthesis